LLTVEALLPLDPLMASSITSWSSPNSLPTSIASELTSRWVADSKLLSAFSAWPAPTGPTCSTRLPRTSSIRRTAATGSSAPPAVIIRLPATAPRTPPDTGASTIGTPCSSASAASSRVRTGSDEDMSIRTAPGAIRASSPSSSSTEPTIAEFGSMRTTAAAESAASPAESATEPAVPANLRRTAGSVSYPRTV
jgi:hypothetical protein